MVRAKGKRVYTTTAKHGFTLRVASTNSNKVNFALQRTTKSKQTNKQKTPTLVIYILKHFYGEKKLLIN